MEPSLDAATYKSSPDAGALESFFSDLVRCETRLYNALNERLRLECGIVTSQFEFLARIRERPGSRVGDLAAFFAVGIGATSKGIDRLVAQGWVRRVPNPSDGRSSLLALTDTGQRLLDKAEQVFAEQLRALVVPAASPARVRAAAATLSRLREALEQAGVGVPAG